MKHAPQKKPGSMLLHENVHTLKSNLGPPIPPLHSNTHIGELSNLLALEVLLVVCDDAANRMEGYAAAIRIG